MHITNLSRHVVADKLPRGAVLVLGYFDGVHLGHQALLGEARAISHDLGGAPVCVWTFESMPKASSLITTNREKCRLFSLCGAEYAVFEDFSSLKSMDGRKFFREYIIPTYAPSCVVCGFNFRFGENASCSGGDLEKMAREIGIECRIVPPFKIDGIPVSSTEIRSLISSGDVSSAARLLGHPYGITSTIVHGAEIGRTIGIRTINQRFEYDKIIPRLGVYACTVTIDRGGEAETRMGVCNIGSRPTVNSDPNDITAETHLLDFDGDLYGTEVRTDFVKMLREERKFHDLDALAAQIERDEKEARLILKDILHG